MKKVGNIFGFITVYQSDDMPDSLDAVLLTETQIVGLTKSGKIAGPLAWPEGLGLRTLDGDSE